MRFKTRLALHNKFQTFLANSDGVISYVVELAYGERPYEVTEANNPRHLRLRTREILWHKENMINLIIQRMPLNARYIAWVDADISFSRADWAIETVQQLQFYDFVQMWSHAHDLGPNNQPILTHTSFAYDYVTGANPFLSGKVDYPDFKWHPGFAWAARRKALTDVGGLIDFAILGAADHHMALGLIGKANVSLPKDVSADYRAKVLEWQVLAEASIRHNVGFVDGLILHYFHGKKRERGYENRWQVLFKNGFAPETDIKKDLQGLIVLAGNKSKLRDAIRAYFRSRNEDSVDL